MREPLNYPGRFAHWFVDSKITILVIIASLVAGIVAVLTTPREENPQITMPAAEVIVTLPGASPSEVEEQLVKPIERVINQIPGIDHVYSTAMDSAAVLTVQYKVGEEKQSSLVQLYDRLNSARHTLPKEAGAPRVISADADDVPILTVTLSGGGYDDYALRRIAERFVEGLTSLKTVSNAYVYDGRTRQFEVTVDPKKLASFGVPSESVRAALQTANISAPLGDEAASGEGRRLRYSGFVTSAEALRHLVIAAPLGRPVLLQDVAEVSDGPATERTLLSRWAPGPASDLKGTAPGEEPSVTFAAAKKKGANAVNAADDMLGRIDRMKAQYLPSGVRMIVTRNDGAKANDAVNTVIGHIGISIAAVFGITWLFLGFRAACITGITIPLIMALTLFINEAAGLTINRVTLFGFVIALGLLVDDSIVVIENIDRNYAADPMADRSYTAARAVAEIGYPTMIATFTVMLVFYTLIPTLQGMPGQYFFSIGFTVPSAVFCSLVIAYSVAPWAAKRILKVPAVAKKESSAPELNRLGKLYYRTASKLIGKKVPTRIFLALLALLVTLSLLMPLWQFVRPQGVGGPVSLLGVQTGFLPKDNKNTFNVTLKLADGTPLEVTDRAVRDVSAVVRSIPEVTDVLSWSGGSGVPDFTALFRGSTGKGSNIGAVRVNLVDKKKRDRSSITIAEELRESLRPVAARYPLSTIQVVEEPPGPPMRATVLAEIYGTDGDRMRAVAERVRDEFRKTYDMVETTSSEQTDIPEARFEVDQEKAALAKVVPAQAALALRRYTAGETLGYAHATGERNAQPVILRADYESKVDPAALSGLTVKNRLGEDVPLSQIVRVTRTTSEHPILNKDGARTILIGGELGHSVPVYAVLDLDKRLDGMAAGLGETLRTGNLGLVPVRADLSRAPMQLLWDGEMRMTLDCYHDLIIALSAAILIIYFILVAYYRSFLLPLTVMSAIPVCFIGLFPGHWATGQIFSATSLIGLVTLTGVLVRNSLLIADFVVEYMQRGLPVLQAVLDAGAVRLRPIMLTSLAIIFGSCIMLVDPVFGGLGCSFIFGTIASTAFTMALTPVMLYWYYTRWPYKPADSEKTEA